MENERKILAERYLRGVYGGDPSVVDALAAENVVSSYPIFARLFGTPALHGQQAVKRFVRGFSSRWTEAQVTIHEAIAEEERVVFLWSFCARRVDDTETAPPPDSPLHAWGGITLFRFNTAGRITAEIGEESTPGPWARLTDRPADTSL
jgi:hypothetical protein